MESSPEYISISEAVQITGYSRDTVLDWCRQGWVKSTSKGRDHQNRLRPNIQSLFAFLNERAQGEQIPKCLPIPARQLNPNIEACMKGNKVQLQAHSFLLNHPDMIECRRGGRLLLSACQIYVLRHYGLPRCVGCIGCEHYKAPEVLPKEDQKQGFQFVTQSQMDGHADMRGFHHQAPQLFAAKETKDRQPKSKLQADHDARYSERKAKMTEAAKNRGANIEEAKRLYWHKKKTHQQIADILGVSRITIRRWITGKTFR